MQSVELLVSGYDRRKNPARAAFRPMTVEEAKNLRPGGHAEIKAQDGKVRNVKINGKPKTWKTRPNDVSVPIKYGMYEYATLSADVEGQITNGVATLIVRVSDGEELRD